VTKGCIALLVLIPLLAAAAQLDLRTQIHHELLLQQYELVNYMTAARAAAVVVRAVGPCESDPSRPCRWEGAGVMIGDHTVLSVAHIMHRDDNIYVFSSRPRVQADVLVTDTDRDVMILRVPERLARPIKLGDDPGAFERVVMVGAAGGYASVVFWGRVSVVSRDLGRLLIDATIMQGMSGSGVVALEGRNAGKLIGLVFRAWGDEFGRMTVAVSVDAVRDVLAENEIHL